MNQIGIGVIGVGLMGSLFARLASQSKTARLVGVADVDEVRAKRLSDSLNVAAFRDYHDLLAHPQVDAVVIATPDTLHVGPALAALEASKHVFIEKPIATTPDDALSIINAAESAGRVLMVGHVLRFDPHYGEAAKAVKSGRLGEVVHVNARRNTSIEDAERLAGRVSITFYLGIHSVDVIQWIVGSPIVEVTAVSARKFMKPFGADDVVVSLLRFENGAVGTLENSWIRPDSTSSGPIGASLYLMGTDGALEIAPYRANLNLYSRRGVEPIIPAYSFDDTILGKIDSIYLDEFDHFLECVRTGAMPVVTPKQAFSAVLVCDAIERSLREKRSISIAQENVFF